jgi:histidine phosphotransferase ChpT
MSVEVDFRVLELLCARLCHELISPVGAINNGVELLDEDDPEFVKEAMTLIGQSARKAGQRLQFYRFAYGTAGAASGGASIDGRDLSVGLLEGGKVRCDWSQEARDLALPWQRIGCNMLVLALEVLPRGGTVLVRPLDGGVEVTAEGETINVSADLRSLLEGDADIDIDALTSRTVHAFYTMRLAQHMGARLALAVGPNRAVLTAASGG